MVYEGTPNSNYLIQLPRTGTGDVNWQREFPVHNYSGKSCQDALSTQNTSQQYFGKGQGTCPITNQSSKLHQQARYRLPDTINQTVQTLAQKLQTIYDLRNVENYANIRHRRRHYPENTSTILHQQHRNNKHLQRSQDAYLYKSPSWTRW